MLKNYLKIAWRNLLKYKFISFINLFGLSIGITCCLLVALYVSDELRYDRYNKHAERIYRVERTFLNPEDKSVSLALGSVAPPIAPLLKNDFKEIQVITSLYPVENATFQYQDKRLNEEEIYFADENLFNVFDFQLAKGNSANALKEPFSMLVTEEMAHKYFGSENPLNKLIKLNNQFVFTVTGVYKALPNQSHWHPQVMLSFATLKDKSIYGAEALRTNWGNNSFFDYILLPKNYDAKLLEKQFPAFLDRHIAEENSVKAHQWSTLSLRNLKDIHLHSHKDSELEENGDIKRIYIFTVIGFFILLIACINYMNLSTARSALRAKEIGIRKVVGAEKRELIYQFLSESILLSLLAMLISLLITGLALPGLNSLSGKQIAFYQLIQPKALMIITLLSVFTGMLSGLYPALFLSGFKPIKVLKGIIKNGEKTLSLRKLLVVFQFATSIALIIGTIIIFRQLNYMQNKSLGFDKEQIVILENDEALKNSFPSFKTTLLANPTIKEIGRSSRIPSGRLLDAQAAQMDLGNGLAPTKADIKYVRADEGFIPTYSISIKAGRNFNRSDGTDSLSFIINETAVNTLGLKSNEEAIGKPFNYSGRSGQIAGVMNDFNFESLHQRIIPLVLFNATALNDYGRISIKIKGNIQQALKHIQTTWEEYLPEKPFEYTFLDDRFADLYKAEHQQQIIFSLFSCIAIVIACLGLFGLSSFTITQRIKEIGIRKVLGASTKSIIQLLSINFLFLVGISALVSFPITWYVMSRWLSDFAYRVSLEWWVFIMTAILALLIAFFTISFQAIKAALANPVDSLRNE